MKQKPAALACCMHYTAPIRTLKLRTLGQGSTWMGDQLGAAGIGINAAMRRVDSE